MNGLTSGPARSWITGQDSPDRVSSDSKDSPDFYHQLVVSCLNSCTYLLLDLDVWGTIWIVFAKALVNEYANASCLSILPSQAVIPHHNFLVKERDPLGVLGSHIRQLISVQKQSILFSCPTWHPLYGHCYRKWQRSPEVWLCRQPEDFLLVHLMSTKLCIA